MKSKLYGLALDAKDGQTRITRAENFELVGGSKETHEKMREVATKVDEGLKKAGKNLESVSNRELVERIVDACERVNPR